MTERSNMYRGHIARDYEATRSHSSIWSREDEILEELLRNITQLERFTVLDVPVGTGRFMDLYKQIGCSVLGIDISDEMLAQARERSSSEARFVVADARALPLRSSIAEVAVCIRFAHLIDRSLLKATLHELQRSLKRGGFLIIGARLHSLAADAGIRRPLKGAFDRTVRSMRFRLGRANSHSHSERWLLRCLRNTGFNLNQRRHVTRYNDGSYYAIFMLAASRRGDVQTHSVELFGLPGVGKSTTARAVIGSNQSCVVDGLRSIEHLSLWQCFRAQPLASARFISRLLPVVGELRTPAAKRVVVNALRQHITNLRANGKVLHEEGTSHEVWRQLMSGNELSDALIGRVLPAADIIVFLEAPVAKLIDRLSTKASPGPISRMLLNEPVDGPVWRRAISQYERIKGILQSGTTTHSIPNNGDLCDAQSTLRKIVIGSGD